MRILRTASVAIHVRASFVVLVLLYAVATEAEAFLSLLFLFALFAAFLVHELGHVIVARFLGRATETTIGGAGGQTIVFGPALRAWQRLAFLFSGVLSSYLLAEASAWALQKGVWSHAVIHETLFAVYNFSVLWFWCNVIPLYPFDGGEAAVVIGGALFGRVGRILASALSILMGLYLVFFGVLNRMIPVGIVAVYSLIETFLLLHRPQGLHGGVLSDEAQKLHEIRQRWLNGRQDQAISELKLLVEGGKEACVRKEALESYSEYLIELDRFREAYEALSQAKDTLSVVSLEHLALAGYKTSHWSEGLEAGREAFRQCPSLSTASLCAMLSARLALEEETVNWLQTAGSMGLRKAAEFVATNDFDPIRSGDRFQKYLTQSSAGRSGLSDRS